MIIETENLTKIYRTEEVETTALDNINLQLAEGQFASISGRVIKLHDGKIVSGEKETRPNG